MLRFPIPKKVALDSTDAFIILILSAMSFGARLFLLQSPDSVVFDEVHFGNFTNWYTLSRYFFDIHPPLAKLTTFLFANLSEYDGLIDFEGNFGRQYKDPQYLSLRIPSAFFSALCSPLIYLTVRFSGFSAISSFVSAFLILCDTSLLTEHRFILSDGILHFFCCLFLALYSYNSTITFTSQQWSDWMILCGISLGAACSCKNTSWGLAIYAVFVQLFMILKVVKKLTQEVFEIFVYRVLLLALPAVSVYFLSYLIHFVILPFSGQGDAYLPEEMKPQLLKSADDLWARRLIPPNIYVRIVTLAVSSHVMNMGITQFHPFQSRPINWPLLTGISVAFWSGMEGDVNCLGNAFVYYFAFASLVANLFAFKRPKWHVAMEIDFAWAISYFPFFLIPRSMYLYHYLIPLMIGCMSVGASLDIWFDKKWRGIIGTIICCLAFFGFIIWSPYSYGTKHLDQDVIIWNSNWLYGDEYHKNLSANHKD